MSEAKKKVCEFCGNEFTVSREFVKYCSKVCSKKAHLKSQSKSRYEGSHKSWECQKANKAAEERAAKARKKNQQELINISVEARKLGMSYGKYVAMMEMKGKGM